MYRRCSVHYAKKLFFVGGYATILRTVGSFRRRAILASSSAES
ncbi:hypothetical protein [Thomasclavelia spiroformis]